MSNKTDSEIIQRLSNIYRIDFQRFAADCLMIRPKNGGLIPFHFNSVQLDLLDKFYEQMQIHGRVRFIVLKARQMGISTFIEALIYWWTVHHTGTKSLVLTHLDDATKELFEMTRRYNENTPLPFKTPAKRDSVNELVFQGIDCAIKTATAGSKNVGHGSTIQCLHWSEVSRSNNQADMTAGVMQTVPSGEGSMIFLESTANGTGEYFHETWQAAIRGESEFIPIFYPWTAMEEYRADSTGVEFSKEELDYQALYGVDDEQLAWRQAKMRQFKGSPEEKLALFQEQYPITPEEAFRSSGNSFISKKAVAEARKADLEPYGAIVCGVDPAAGGKDSTAIVLRQGQKVLKAWRFKHPDLMAIVGRCVDVINDYQVDMMFVDCVGLGLGVYSRLAELGYNDRIMEVKASRRADEPDAYVNKRAEMWDRMAQWLERGADIPDNDIFESDLLMLSAEYDSSRRLKMQSKKDIAHSPDLADALSFTFALNHVVPKSEPEEYEGLRRAPTYGGSMLNGNI